MTRTPLHLLPMFLLPLLYAAPLLAEEKQTILDKSLPELKLEKISVKDALDFMKEISGASFEVDWKAFKNQKVTEKSVVSVQIKNEKLSEVLRKIFVSAGATHDPVLAVKKEKIVTIKPGADPNASKAPAK
ncbi:MAG TPA: hypothetical protein VF669_21405 [Tepidisphaeraceae bacterium]|jgi:type II secretory pathway component GspD/PulD (secretin)